MTEAYRQSVEKEDKVSDSVTFYNLGVFFHETEVGDVDSALKGRSNDIFEVIYEKKADVCEGRLLVDLLDLSRVIETSMVGQEDVRERLASYVEGRIDQFRDLGKPFSDK